MGNLALRINKKKMKGTNIDTKAMLKWINDINYLSQS